MAEAVLLTPEQVAKRFQVKERTVLDWLRSGHLPGVKLGRLWRIQPEAVEAFLTAAAPRKEIQRTPAPPARPQGKAARIARRRPSKR
jgi:excisionase family DNA binding protein